MKNTSIVTKVPLQKQKHSVISSSWDQDYYKSKGDSSNLFLYITQGEFGFDYDRAHVQFGLDWLRRGEK